MAETVEELYDVIVIGAGQYGGPLSTAFAKAGKPPSSSGSTSAAPASTRAAPPPKR